MPRKGFKTVPIPEELYDVIQKIVSERKELGYDSIAEFVRDAIRRRLRELGYEGF